MLPPLMTSRPMPTRRQIEARIWALELDIRSLSRDPLRNAKDIAALECAIKCYRAILPVEASR